MAYVVQKECEVPTWFVTKNKQTHDENESEQVVIYRNQNSH